MRFSASGILLLDKHAGTHCIGGVVCPKNRNGHYVEQVNTNSPKNVGTTIKFCLTGQKHTHHTEDPQILSATARNLYTPHAENINMSSAGNLTQICNLLNVLSYVDDGLCGK